jgi:transposase
MDRRYVGIDLRRRRSVIYAMDAAGDRLFCERIDNEPMRLLEVVGRAGVDAEVVIEATYGWYWAVDLLKDAGFCVHLAHPSGNDWGQRRVKNDERDARDLADLLRLGRLAEAWIAPPSVREARELVRYRARLVQLRSGLKAQVHAVMAKEGVLPGVTDMFGSKGQQLLDAMELADAYLVRVESLRDLITVYDREVGMLEHRIHELLRDDRGYQAIQALDGVGRTIASIFVTEIGDIGRFRTPGSVVLLGRSHPASSGVRHQGRARQDHQTRLEVGPLGRARSDRPLPRRSATARHVPSRRRTARHQQSAHRDRPPAHDLRLLRPPRRRDPLPPPGRRVKLGHDPKRARNRHDSHPGGDVDELIEPLRVVARPHHAPHPGANRCLATEPPRSKTPWCGTSQHPSNFSRPPRDDRARTNTLDKAPLLHRCRSVPRS